MRRVRKVKVRVRVQGAKCLATKNTGKLLH